MITQEIREDAYRIAGSTTGFVTPGEYGPLACGCCVVACEFDPVGPRLIFVMMRMDAQEHTHASLADFESVLP